MKTLNLSYLVCLHRMLRYYDVKQKITYIRLILNKLNNYIHDC